MFDRPTYETQITEEDDRNLPKRVLQVIADLSLQKDLKIWAFWSKIRLFCFDVYCAALLVSSQTSGSSRSKILEVSEVVDSGQMSTSGFDVFSRSVFFGGSSVFF